MLQAVLWLCDQHFCVQLYSLPGGVPNPQFHAWWHMLMGANCYLGGFPPEPNTPPDAAPSVTLPHT